MARPTGKHPVVRLEAGDLRHSEAALSVICTSFAVSYPVDQASPGFGPPPFHPHRYPRQKLMPRRGQLTGGVEGKLRNVSALLCVPALALFHVIGCLPLSKVSPLSHSRALLAALPYVLQSDLANTYGFCARNHK